MTQHYIAGEFSALLGGLQPTSAEGPGAALGSLRREVESSSLAMLPQLARAAMSLADTLCWLALEQGDASGFFRSAEAAAALREFAADADLLP